MTSSSESTKKDEQLGEQIEAAIDGVRNACEQDSEDVARDLIPEDACGQLLARVLGGLGAMAPADLTRTESGSGSSGSGFVDDRIDHVGKYRIIRKLGQGGMGTVYEACDSFDPDATPVALKTIKSDNVEQPNAVERFVRELKSMGQVRHEQIVPVLDSGADNGIPFFTMPLVDGEDFAKRIYGSKDPPDLNELRIRTRVVEEVCRAAECIHQAGILHRDIKPGNIFVLQDGSQSLLGDFGLAKALDEGKGQADFTRTNAIVGSFRYAAPEQLRGKPDVCSDIYALGITLYAALSGRRPFDDKSDSEIISNAGSLSLTPIQQLNPSVPDEIAIACHRAIENHPEDRYQTAAAFGHDLNLALHGRRPNLLPISKAGRFIRQAIRHPARTASVLMVVAITFLFCWLYSTRPAYLELTVQPRSAVVTLDGQPIQLIDGIASWKGKPGSRTISVQAEQHDSIEFDLDLVRGRENLATKSVQLDSLIGRIEVDSVPSGASVIVRDQNDRVLASGTTPFRSPDLDSGSVNIELTLPLFKPQLLKADVPRAGQTNGLETLRLQAAFSKEHGSASLGYRISELQKPFPSRIQITDATLPNVIERVSQQTEYELSLVDSQSWKTKRPSDYRLNLDAGSLEDLRIAVRDLGLRMMPAANPRAWKVITFGDAERDRPQVVFSLANLKPRLTVAQVMNLVTQHVNPASWEQLGGPNVINSITSYRAISVVGDFDTLVGVSEYIKNLAALSVRDSSNEKALRNVWSDQVPIGRLHSIVEDFPFELQSPRAVIQGSESSFMALAFVDEQRLLTGAESSSLRLWDLETCKPLREFETERYPANCIVVFPGRSTEFVIGDRKGDVTHYDIDQAKPIHRQWRHHGNVNALAFSSDGQYMFSTGSDGLVIRYGVSDLKFNAVGQMDDNVSSMVAFTRKGKGYIAVNRTSLEDVWVVEQDTMAGIAKFDVHDPLAFLAHVPETPIKREFKYRGREMTRPGKLIVAGTQLSALTASPSLASVSVSEVMPMNVKAVEHIAKYHLIATLHSNGRLIFRDEATLKPQAVLRLASESARFNLAFSADCKKLAVSRWDSTKSPWRAVVEVYNLIPTTLSPITDGVSSE